MPSANDGIMVILSSPSGAGKTTLVNLLSKQNNFEIFDGDNLCNTSWEVISLMSKSKVVISSNSSFSWWGAYLSKGLKISPILSLWESHLCTPDEWVQINDGNINPHIWSKLPVFGKIKFKNEFLLSNNILYKKIFFKYEGRDVMAYSMENKTPFKYPSTRYLNIIKQGYKDCNLDTKFLVEALKG